MSIFASRSNIFFYISAIFICLCLYAIVFMVCYNLDALSEMALAPLPLKRYLILRCIIVVEGYAIRNGIIDVEGYAIRNGIIVVEGYAIRNGIIDVEGYA